MVATGVVIVVEVPLGINNYLYRGELYNFAPFIIFNMKYICIVLLILIISLLNCKDETKPLALERKELNNKITIIFNKKNYKKDTLRFNNGSYMVKNNPIVSYVSKQPFHPKPLLINNTKKSDTITISTDSKIFLDHRYHFYYSSSYIFYPGDSIIFDYIDGVPYCSILNRNISKKSLNFEANYNILNQVYEDEGAFWDRNKKFRSKKQRNEYFVKLRSNLFNLNKSLDSLQYLNLISKENYLFHQNKIKYRNAILSFTEINFSEMGLKNDSLLVHSSFRHFLNYFVVQKFAIKLKKRRNGRMLDYKNSFDSVMNSNLFSKKNKNYLLYNFMQSIAENYSIEVINTYLKKFKAVTRDSNLYNNLKHKYLLDFSELKKETKKVHFINLKKEKFTLSKVIEQHKGKIIFIDFWASWCGPCREAMPASKELQKTYKSKNMVFIYISIDKDFNKWKKASQEEGLSFYKNNILAINYPNANFYKELKLKTIPRYLLYDKKGNLVHSNASGPKTEELKKLLDSYLKKE